MYILFCLEEAQVSSEHVLLNQTYGCCQILFCLEQAQVSSEHVLLNQIRGLCQIFAPYYWKSGDQVTW